MKKMIIISLFFSILFCSKPKQAIDVTDLNFFSSPQKISAGYFKIKNNSDSTVKLIGVKTNELNWEIHETIIKNEIASMKSIDSILIPGKKTIVFKRGGKHIMTSKEINKKIKLQFHFSNGSIIEKSVTLKPLTHHNH